MNPSRTRGFTLIELLVVVAILSAASLLAFGAFTEDRAQLRYDDTRTRLQVLRRAILGVNGPVVPDGLGGFVADNGELPPGDLATLLAAGGLVAQGAQAPVFDPQPDTASCAHNGADTTALTDAAAVLVKGHRGDYLGGLAANGRLRDGWGNVAAADDALNFGWSVALAGDQLVLASLGADNSAGGVDYDADQSLTIAAADWQVPLMGWTVTVVNKTGATVSRNLSVSLLAFRNASSGGQWLRYSTPIAVVSLAAGESQSFGFAANCKAGDAASGEARAAQGQHLLVVTSHAGTTLWQATDAHEWEPGKTSFARVKLAAGLLPPDVRLELR